MVVSISARGHVALVAVFDAAERLHHHRRIHDADARDGQDRRLALERRIHQVLPVADRPADEVGTDAERVGVVDRRDQRHPLGGVRREFGRGLAVHEADRVRRGALGDLRGRRQLAGDEDRHDLVVVGDLPGIHRLQHAGGEHLLAQEILDVGDVVGFRLGHRLLRHRVGVERGHLQGEAEVLLHLLGDGVQVGYAGAELAQRHVLDLLRPDGGEPADGAAADRRTGELQRTASSELWAIDGDPACHDVLPLGRYAASNGRTMCAARAAAASAHRNGTWSEQDMGS